MSDLLIRGYRPEDLPDVVKLYDSSRVECPFFLRNKDYFEFFLSYPGVREDSVFVAVSEKGIEGIAIIAVAQKSYAVGKVIELWASEAKVENALLQKTIEYCRNGDIDSVEVSPPAFLDSKSIFAGWLKINRGGAMMVKPLSLVPLLQALLDTTAQRKIGAGKGFLFVCGDETIEVKTGETGVTVAESAKSQQDLGEIVVRADSKSLLGVVFGLTNPYMAFLTGQIKIQGIRNIFRTMRMLRAIRIDQPWAVATADIR